MSGDAGTPVGLVALAGDTPRSDLIVAAVDLLLRAAGLAPPQLGAVVVTRGPGSFTGIRVALATAQGITFGVGVPAHGFSSLLTQAARTLTAEVLAVQPARRGEVYAQPFSRRNGVPYPTAEPHVRPLTSLATSSLPVIAPDGLELPLHTPRAAPHCTTVEGLLHLAASFPGGDADVLVPLYVQPPSAVPQREA